MYLIEKEKKWLLDLIECNFEDDDSFESEESKQFVETVKEKLRNPYNQIQVSFDKETTFKDVKRA